MLSKVETFQGELEREHVRSSHTRMAYASDLKRLAAYLGSLSIQDWAALTPDHIKDFLEDEAAAGRSQATLQRRLAAIRLYVRYLVETEVLKHDFSSELILPFILSKEQRVADPLAQEETDALHHVLESRTSARGQRDHALFILLLKTGLTVGQVLNLNLEMISDQPAGLKIRPGRPGVELLLNGPSAEILAAYLKTGRPALLQRPKEPALFVSQMGRRMTRQAVWVMLRKLGEAAGLKTRLTPRRIRYTLANGLLQEGLKLEEIQRRMGHRVLLSTKYMAAQLRGEHSSMKNGV